MPEYRRATEADPGFVYVEDFLPADDCRCLIRWFEENRTRCVKDAPGSTFFDDRYVWFTSLPDEAATEKEIMQRARYRARDALRRYYRIDRVLYSDTIQLVCWPEGVEMAAHSDNSHPSGARHNTPWRDFGAVVYLNDDFDDGEFFFEHQKLAVKPKTGLLIAFPGGESHRHGVRAPRGGVRYTMPGWFTFDPQREERGTRQRFGSFSPPSPEGWVEDTALEPA